MQPRNGRPMPPRNGRPMLPRNWSRIQVRKITNTEGISDNQQVTRNGVKERKKERKKGRKKEQVRSNKAKQ
jgi:hypothetical protein